MAKPTTNIQTPSSAQSNKPTTPTGRPVERVAPSGRTVPNLSEPNLIGYTEKGGGPGWEKK
jgi:hypothetical protein